MPIAEAQRLGSLGAAPDVHVRLGDAGYERQLERPRLGTEVRMTAARHKFKTLLSSRARHVSHSGEMEAVGITLATRWLLRTSRFHNHRFVLLVDAQAPLACLRKGRSSAPTLARATRRTAAALLAGNLTVSSLYVPSEKQPR